MIFLHVLFDPKTNQITLAPGNEDTRLWQIRDDAKIAVVMNGISQETPKITGANVGAVLDEVGRRLAYIAAESTGGMVQVRTGTGKVITGDDVRKKGLLADARKLITNVGRN